MPVSVVLRRMQDGSAQKIRNNPVLHL